jgi:hypothetical protein
MNTATPRLASPQKSKKLGALYMLVSTRQSILFDDGATSTAQLVCVCVCIFLLFTFVCTWWYGFCVCGISWILFYLHHQIDRSIDQDVALVLLAKLGDTNNRIT